jgi:hypothetical protein
MATWLTANNFPQKFEQDGFTDAEPSIFIKTEMDAGPPKLRRRFTAGHRPISGTMIITSTQKASLKTFYQTYGSVEFNFPDPDTGSTVSVIFMAPPEYTSYAGIYWQVKLQFSIMP